MKLLSTLACAALFASLVACSGEVDSNDPVPGSVTSEPAPSAPGTDRARADGNAFAAPAKGGEASGFVCREGAFCEDFEERGYDARWTGQFTTGRSSIELGKDSASAGGSSLRLFAYDASSSAYLLQQAKADVAGDWSGLLGFAFRLDQLPGESLGLSELTVKSPDGPLTIRITMRPEGLFLEQLATGECLRDRCVSSRKVIAAAKPNHWYRVKLGLEVNGDRAAAPYGRLEASVDDGAMVGVDLGLPLTNGSAFMSAGIVQGDAGRRAFADLDDVTLLVR